MSRPTLWTPILTEFSLPGHPFLAEAVCMRQARTRLSHASELTLAPSPIAVQLAVIGTSSTNI